MNNNKSISLKKIVQTYGLIIIFVLLFVFFSLARPNFLTVANLSRAFVTNVVSMTVSIGAFFIVAINEFDMSLGYMLGMIHVFGGFLAERGVNDIVVLVLILAMGIAAGLINGLLVVKLKIKAVIATLGVGIFFYGVNLILSNGLVLNAQSLTGIIGFAQGRLFSPQAPTNPVYLIYIIGILMAVFIGISTFGKHIYAVGGNPRAAKLSGVKVEKVRILAFMLAGLFVAIAAIFLLGQSKAGNSARGTEYLMPAYATVFLSLTVFKPGKFNLQGVLLANLVITVSLNGLSLMGVPFWFESVFYGIILFISVLITEQEARSFK